MNSSSPSIPSANNPIKDLQSTIQELLRAIEPALPSAQDYGLSGPPKAMLREATALAGALGPNEHAERADLLFVRVQLLEQLSRHRKARFEGVQCVTAATRAFFGTAKGDLWLRLHWRRIRALAEAGEWLPCERALSEMIGALRTSSRPERVAACRRALALRGHLLQLRGLSCQEPEHARAFLDAGLRDLEEVPDHVGESDLESARRRARVDQQEEPLPVGQERSTRPDSPGSEAASIGPPPGDVGAVRRAFYPGLSRSPETFLTPQRNPLSVLLMIGFFLVLAIALLTGVWNLPWSGPFLRLVAAIPVMTLLAASVRILRDLGTWRRNRAAGLETFGLSLDRNRLAAHTVDAFSNYTYFYGRNGAWIPLCRIRAILVRREPIYAMAGRMVKADVLVVRFEDEHGELQSLTLRDTFATKARRIRDLMQTWSNDLLGDWQEERGSGTLQFEPDRCTFADEEGQTIEFTWRELPGGALEFTSLGSSSNQTTRLIHFDLDAKEARLDLRLFEGLDHPSGRTFTRSVQEHVGTLDRDRLTWRVDVLREPRPLVP